LRKVDGILNQESIVVLVTSHQPKTPKYINESDGSFPGIYQFLLQQFQQKLIQQEQLLPEQPKQKQQEQPLLLEQEQKQPEQPILLEQEQKQQEQPLEQPLEQQQKQQLQQSDKYGVHKKLKVIEIEQEQKQIQQEQQLQQSGKKLNVFEIFVPVASWTFPWLSWDNKAPVQEKIDEKKDKIPVELEIQRWTAGFDDFDKIFSFN